MEKLLYVYVCKQVNEKARLLMGSLCTRKCIVFMNTWSTKVGVQVVLKQAKASGHHYAVTEPAKIYIKIQIVPNLCG